VWNSLETKYGLLVVDILLAHFALVTHLLLQKFLDFVYQVLVLLQERHHLVHHRLSEKESLMNMIMVVH